MVPEGLAVGALVELGDAHALGVACEVLGDNVHRDFGEVQVGADAGGGGDARCVVDVLNQMLGQLPGVHRQCL